VEACKKAGKWVPEEPHEWGPDEKSLVGADAERGGSFLKEKNEAGEAELFFINLLGFFFEVSRSAVALYNSPKKCRLHVAKTGRPFFSGWRVILFCAANKHDKMKFILEQGGANILADKPPFDGIKVRGEMREMREMGEMGEMGE
jgi:hypothetical protein